MIFEIIVDGKKFVIRDNDGTEYGIYPNREEAEANLIFWQEYYDHD